MPDRVKLTEAQRSWLEYLATQHLCVLDIKGGATSQCLDRLKTRGLIEYVNGGTDWRDGTLRITPAGRALLASNAKTGE